MGYTVEYGDGRKVEFKNKPTKADIDEADISTQRNILGKAKTKTEDVIRSVGEKLPMAGAIAGELVSGLPPVPILPPPAKRIIGAALGGASGELANRQIQKDPIPTASRITAPAVQGITGLPTQLLTPPQEKPDPRDIDEAASAGMGFGILSTAGELVGAGLKGIGRSRAKELAERITPKAMNAIKTSFIKFNEPIQKWFKTKFDVPDSVLATIKEKGVEAVQATKQKLGDTVDDFYFRLRDGVLKKEAEAQAAEKAVYDQVGKGRVIDITDYIDKGLAKLKSIGRVTKADNLSPTGQQVARQGNVLDDLFDRLMELRRRTQTGYDIDTPYLSRQQTIDVGREGLGARFQPKIKRTNVSKIEYQILKDEINRWFRGASGAEQQVLKQVKKAFIKSGERAGLTGLREADRLYSAAIKKTGQFINNGELKNITRSTLENWHKSGTKARNLANDLATYIDDTGIVDDLDVFHAGKYVERVNKYLTEDASKNVFGILKGAIDGVQRGQVRKQLVEQVGEKMANDIIGEIASFGFWRRAGKVVGGTALFGAAKKAKLLPFGGGEGNQ